MPNENPEDIPDALPGDISDENPGDIPDAPSKDMPNENPGDIPLANERLEETALMVDRTLIKIQYPTGR